LPSWQFHPSARADLLEAGRHYRDEAPSPIARSFLKEVTQGIRFILANPEASPVVHRTGVRRKVLRRFPYNLYYVVASDMIRILAVGHQSRRPRYWTNRL
jgi:plasmid stabilization system protein ParE